MRTACPTRSIAFHTVAGVAVGVSWHRWRGSDHWTPVPGPGVVFDWQRDLYWPVDTGGQLLRALHAQDQRALAAT